jgi:hypothetical protein
MGAEELEALADSVADAQAEELEMARAVIDASRRLTVTLHEQATMDYDAALAAYEKGKNDE